MKKIKFTIAVLLCAGIAPPGRSASSAGPGRTVAFSAAQAQTEAQSQIKASFGGSLKEGLAFAVIGDSGSGHKAQYDVARQMATQRDKLPFDTVIMCGDNIYPKGDASQFKAKFEEPYKGLLENGVRFYAALGNHDAEHGSKAELEYDKFGMGGHRYYSFIKREGLVEFFSLDTTDMNAAQMKWLEEALSASRARWKVVFGHHPLYCSARRHGSTPQLCTRLEPLFVKYKVDVVFSGHDHVYERVKPQNGIYYFTEGASGRLRRGNLDRNNPLYEAGDDQNNSFLLVWADGSQMVVEAIAADGKVLDTATISKGK
jgi:hypothetical protein